MVSGNPLLQGLDRLAVDAGYALTDWHVAIDNYGWGAVLREAIDSVAYYPIDTFVWNVEEQVVPYRSDVGSEQQKVYSSSEAATTR